MNSVRNAQELKHIKSKATTQTTISKQRKKVKGKKNMKWDWIACIEEPRTGRSWMIVVCARRRNAHVCLFKQVEFLRCFLLLSSSFLFIACPFHSLLSSSCFFSFLVCCFPVPRSSSHAILTVAHQFIYVRFTEQPKPRKKRAMQLCECGAGAKFATPEVVDSRPTRNNAPTNTWSDQR